MKLLSGIALALVSGGSGLLLGEADVGGIALATRRDRRAQGARRAWRQVLKEAPFAVYERVRPAKSSEEKALVADAEALRAELLDIFIWAFRDVSRDADLKPIREGDGADDLVADLGDLVEIAAALAARLKAACLERLTTKTDAAASDLREPGRFAFRRDPDLGDLVEIAGPQALGNPACELAEARSVGAR